MKKNATQQRGVVIQITAVRVLREPAVYSVSQKNPLLRFSNFFPKRLEIFNQFCTLIIRSFRISNFYISLEL